MTRKIGYTLGAGFFGILLVCATVMGSALASTSTAAGTLALPTPAAKVHIPFVTRGWNEALDPSLATVPSPFDSRWPNRSWDPSWPQRDWPLYTVPIQDPLNVCPVEAQAEWNLGLRGYRLADCSAFSGSNSANCSRSLIDYAGATDSGARQLSLLFVDRRAPTISNVYQVFEWNYDAQPGTDPGYPCRGATGPPRTDLLWYNAQYGTAGFLIVHVLGLVTTPGETVHVPACRDGTCETVHGDASAVLLYASQNRATLHYTPADTPGSGYTIHIEGIAIEPSLMNYYLLANASGRTWLPGLRAGEPFARALQGEIRVAIRDNGSFMDPRSRKDWWMGL